MNPDEKEAKMLPGEQTADRPDEPEKQETGASIGAAKKKTTRKKVVKEAVAPADEQTAVPGSPATVTAPPTDDTSIDERHLVKTFTVQVAWEKIEEQFSRTVEQYAREVKIPGFRQGKVPIEAVKSRFKEAIYEDVRTTLLQEAFNEKIKADNLKVVASPEVVKVDSPEGKDLVADIQVEILPDVVIPDLQTIEVSIPGKELEIPPFDEEGMIDGFLESRRSRVPVTDREVRENDIVRIAIQSKPLDTRRLTPRQEFDVEVKPGQESSILDLSAELMGKKVNEKFSLTRQYPADFSKKQWASKEVEHTIEVKAIFVSVKPLALDDHMLKSIGFKDVESFKKALREMHESKREEHRREVTENHIIKRLTEVVSFPLPEYLVTRDAIGRLQAQKDSAPKNPDVEQAKAYFDAIRQQSRESLRMTFVIDAVVDQFKLEALEADLEKEYQVIAQHSRLPLPEIKKYYRQPQYKEDLMLRVQRKKAIAFLKEKVKVKEV